MLQKLKKMIALDNPFRLYYHQLQAMIAVAINHNPSKNMIIIWVTGTNGKTTTSNIIARWLRQAGKKVFLFSTVNIIIDDQEFTNNSKMTSPNPFTLQKLLAEAREKWCEIAIIETSSHSIFMHRNWGLDYDIAVLTNITQDHLDLHKTMQKYAETKLRLFKGLIISKRKKWVKKTAIINLESDYKDLFLAETYDSLYTYGKDMSANIRLENITSDIDATNFDVKIAGNIIKIKTSLRGTFNVYNILASIWVFIALNLKPKEIEKIIASISWVPWRMEEIKNKEGFKIFIDYAHTGDALTQVLNNLRDIQGRKKIITVFWATGDRDKTKRPEMGRIVSDLSDIVVLTQDDDYTEKTEQIIKDVAHGIERKEWEDFWIIPDRKEAIRTALIMASLNDIVLIAWKWDEHTLMTNFWPIPWHDKEVVLEVLQWIDENRMISNE